jgi:excisionase family DNA binding protein
MNTPTLSGAIVREILNDRDALQQLWNAFEAQGFTRQFEETRSAGWLDTAGAAKHLSCPRSRIHDLVGLGKLNPSRDGRRLLFRSSDLDRYLEEQS